jgi:acyl carrier protein
MKNKEEVASVVLKCACSVGNIVEEYQANVKTSKPIDEELGFDSLDNVEFIMDMERELKIIIPDEIGDRFIHLSIDDISAEVFKIVNQQ